MSLCPDFPRPMARAVRERVIYPKDMEGAPSGEADATAVVFGSSPMWLFSGTADNSISMEVKVPMERVPGTDVSFRIEYLMAAGPGGVGVMLVFRYGIFGLGEGPPGLTSTDLPVVPLASPNSSISDPVTIPGATLDAKYQPITVQIVVMRRATDPGDQDSNGLRLAKVIMEYTAYT